MNLLFRHVHDKIESSRLTIEVLAAVGFSPGLHYHSLRTIAITWFVRLFRLKQQGPGLTICSARTDG